MKITKNENIVKYTFLCSILLMAVAMTGNISTENVFYNINPSNITVIDTKIIDGDTIYIDGENLNKELNKYVEIDRISSSEFDTDNVSTPIPISLPGLPKNESPKNESLEEDIIIDEKEINITEDTTVSTTESASTDNISTGFYNVNTSNRTAIVTKIVDGDTIWVSPYDDMLGFVGISAPELGRNGSYEAVDYVAKRIMYKTIYIDIDNKRPKDINGRILAVVYIDGENLNKELLCKRYAEIDLISPSEFDPNSWKLSCPDNVSTSLPTSIPGLPKNENLKEDIITLDGNVKEIDITEDTNEIDLLEKENKENSTKSSPGFESIIIVIVLIYAFRRTNKNG